MKITADYVNERVVVDEGDPSDLQEVLESEGIDHSLDGGTFAFGGVEDMRRAVAAARELGAEVARETKGATSDLLAAYEDGEDPGAGAAALEGEGDPAEVVRRLVMLRGADSSLMRWLAKVLVTLGLSTEEALGAVGKGAKAMSNDGLYDLLDRLYDEDASAGEAWSEIDDAGVDVFQVREVAGPRGKAVPLSTGAAENLVPPERRRPLRPKDVEPGESEGEQEFVSRCVAFYVGEGKEQDQAAAICYDKYRGKGASPSEEKAMTEDLNFYVNREGAKMGFGCYLSDPDGDRVSVSGPVKTLDRLPAGVYDLEFDYGGNAILVRKGAKSDALIRFDDERQEAVSREISAFWQLKDRYAELGLIHKRGVLVYGKPGTGKSCLLKRVSEEAVLDDSVVVYCDSLGGVARGLKQVREVEPDRPMLVVLEDVDTMLQWGGEHDLLELFDGEKTVGGVLYLATTNYPENLDARVTRPGRLDTKVEVGNPPLEGRVAYLMARVPGIEPEHASALAEAAEDFSFAEMRELVVSVYALGADPLESIKRIKAGFSKGAQAGEKMSEDEALALVRQEYGDDAAAALDTYVLIPSDPDFDALREDVGDEVFQFVEDLLARGVFRESEESGIVMIGLRKPRRDGEKADPFLDVPQADIDDAIDMLPSKESDLLKELVYGEPGTSVDLHEAAALADMLDGMGLAELARAVFEVASGGDKRKLPQKPTKWMLPGVDPNELGLALEVLMDSGFDHHAEVLTSMVYEEGYQPDPDVVAELVEMLRAGDVPALVEAIESGLGKAAKGGADVRWFREMYDDGADADEVADGLTSWQPDDAQEAIESAIGSGDAGFASWAEGVRREYESLMGVESGAGPLDRRPTSGPIGEEPAREVEPRRRRPPLAYQAGEKDMETAIQVLRDVFGDETMGQLDDAQLSAVIDDFVGLAEEDFDGDYGAAAREYHDNIGGRRNLLSYAEVITKGEKASGDYILDRYVDWCREQGLEPDDAVSAEKFSLEVLGHEDDDDMRDTASELVLAYERSEYAKGEKVRGGVSDLAAYVSRGYNEGVDARYLAGELEVAFPQITDLADAVLSEFDPEMENEDFAGYVMEVVHELAGE